MNVGGSQKVIVGWLLLLVIGSFLFSSLRFYGGLSYIWYGFLSVVVFAIVREGVK